MHNTSLLFTPQLGSVMTDDYLTIAPQAAEQPQTQTQTQTARTDIPPQEGEQPPGMFGGASIWIMYAVILVGMYFLLMRPQRKREKQQKEMQAGIRTGDAVITSGGLFGKVMDVGEDCFVVEFGTNRGVRIPILKSDVLGIREPKLTPAPKTD